MGPIDRTGDKYGRLTVVSRAPNMLRGQRMRPAWFCLCECGEVIVTTSNNLRTGNTRSCGCLARDSIAAQGKANKTHGDTPTGVVSAEYHAWQNMKDRCSNPNNGKFKHYGGRGIRVCKRWLNSYENFLADMGRKPSRKHSLDRKDVDGNYEPSNCQWATGKEQRLNQRRMLKVIK